MREMILRILAVCIGTVLAAPHLPQTINCPNSDIHVFINQTAVDRSEYTFVDWNAANLQDCVEKCFGNHFCYSIRFDASLEHNCGLYYFAAYNCSNQQLTKASTIAYSGGSITLDCIRCPGIGEFVTAPPFSSVGEQTIVSETAVLARGKNIKGTATEITHNSEHEGKTHGEAEAAKDKQDDEAKKAKEGAVEGSGAAPTTSAPASEGEKSGDEPTASTESTLTGQNPEEGSTSVPSAESTDATTAAPEEAAGATAEAGSTAEAETGAGSTPAGTEDAAGSTVAPESGSTPAESESSTVEGSGEKEEATSPITGESNGEAEFIESSGEGAPSAGAPGTAPPVEGSGVEGSGTGPEISAAEDEEPSKVDVETTTVWNGHTEQPRVCTGNLRFVPSSIIDLDTVQLLINSTKANSPAECAKICYEHNCGFAYYEPSTFICQFMANTEDLVDTTTCPADVKDAKYQAEFRTDVASTLTCVTCAKDSDLDKSQPTLQPVASPRQGSYPACIISFQAAEGDHSSFPFYKSIQVHGLNECARHCFIGECSQSVYNPKTKECRLGSNPKDTCNNLPLLQKVPTPSEEVLMQCFRCIPEDLIGVKGTVSETTGYREPPTAAESIDESAATANKEKEQTAVAATPEPTTEIPASEAPTTEAAMEETTTTTVTESSTTEVPTTEAVTEETTKPVVTELPTEAPTTEAATTEAATEETTTFVSTEAPTTEAPTTEAAITEAAPTTTAEASTEVPTTEAATTETTVTETAATEAPTTEAAVTETAPTQSAEAEISTEAPTTEAAFTEAAPTPSAEAETTTETPTTEAAEPVETTTIAGSGAEVDLSKALPEGVTEKPEEDETTAITADNSTTTEAETTPIGGEEVELEEASGQEATTSSTGYDNESTTAANGETEKAVGKDGEGKATTTVHVEGSGEGEEASTVAPSGESKDAGAATAAGKEGEEAAATTTVAREESKTEGGEEEGTTVATEGETTVAGAEEGVTTPAAEGSSTLTPEEAASTEAGAESSTLTPEEAATSEGPGEMSKAIEANDQPLILASEDLDFGKSCVIKFQASAFSSRPSTLVAPFEKAFSVDSIELCATRCFQDGCTSAKYEPETKTCHLAYDDKPICDRTELHLRLTEVVGEMWIHCVNCYPEKSVVKDVLGAPLNKNTTGEEKEGEQKSMLEKVIGAVSDVAHTVAEKVTGENPDAVLRHGCIVNFQTSPSTEMGEAVEYLPPFKTRYAHRCATKCFQEGCAAASFNPTTNECSLGYGRFVKCNNKPLTTTALDIKETVTIHCMSCIHHKPGEDGVDLVVLSPDDARIHVSESQDVPAEEAEGSGTEDATVSSKEGAESTTESAEGTTAADTEGSTVAGGEETTTVAEGSGSTESSTVAGEGGESTTGSSPTEGSKGEVNGGTLGADEGSGVLEKEGKGRISEVPLASGADGVEIPAGVNLEETAVGKVQVNGEKDEEGKFKPQLPTGFSIDSGLGKVQVDGKMPEGDKGAASGTVGEKPETVTGHGTLAGSETEAGEGSTAAPTGSSTEGTESSTGLTTGEGEATTADESSTETPSDSSTAGKTSSSTPGEESTTGHGTIHPAKEFEATPIHPGGAEFEVGSAEATTGSSTDSGATTSVPEGTTTEEEEESPAFVQGSASEDDEDKEEELSIAPTADELKHREGLVEKALATGKPTVAGSEKPTAADATGAEKTTVTGVEGEAGKSTVAPVGSTTPSAESSATVSEPTTSSSWDTPTGELDAMAATDGEPTATSTPSETTTAAVSDEAATTSATADLQHREGILEKALATANPALTTKEGSSTPSSESADGSSSSTAEPTAESTVASSTEGTVEGGETTVAASTEGTVAAEGITVAASTEGTVGESTVSPTMEGMAESIDEKAKEEAKEVEEEMAQKGEVKATEKGAASASLDAGSSTVAPSDESGSTSSSATDAPTSTVPSPADLAKSQHHEKGGAEFGQTGEKGTNEKGVEEPTAVKGEVKGSGAKGASAASSIDASSTISPSDTEGSTASSESDAATGELTTSSSIDGGVGGMAREGEAESTTSSASETESTTGASEDSSTVSSVEGTESSTPSSEGGDSSTVAASESHVADKEGILLKALNDVAPKVADKGGIVSTTTVPSPADLAKSQHHEKGGAEFGQTGAKGTNEKEIGEKEDEIKSSTINPVESSTANGESLDGGIDSALSAIGEKTTTEPPVQAVKDLLDALASGDFDRALLGKKANGTDADQLLKGKTQITDVATPINQKHECTTGKLRFSTFELVDLTTKFEADAVALSLPHCARLCYEIGCTMAAYSRFPRPLCLMHFEKDEKESHRCNGETNRTSHWEYSSLQQVVAIDCIQCEGQTFFEHDHTVDITTLHAIDDSIVTVPSPQGISKNCDGGRLEFQFVPAGSLPRLNVTNDVPARTPADCARKCHETKGCTTAGFIPTPSLEIANGVCLLTSDDEVCISREDAVPQHASVTAFVISCIRCTSCSYTLSHMTLSSSTAKFQHISTVKTIGECATVCNDKKCVFAQYDATTNTCALSMEATLESGCNKVEPSLAVKGAYPVRLECVQCKE